MNEVQKKKIGDVLCDIGKYMLTVVPFGYFFSEQDNAALIVAAVAFAGIFFITSGILVMKKCKDTNVTNSKTVKKKIKVLRNTTFYIEET